MYFISGDVLGGAVIRMTIYIEFTAPETDKQNVDQCLWLGLTPSDVWMRIIEIHNVVQFVGNP